MTAGKKWALLNLINSKKYCHKSIGIDISNTFCKSILIGIGSSRDANVPSFGGIFPLHNRFYAIPSGNDEIPLYTDFLAQVSHVDDDVGEF